MAAHPIDAAGFLLTRLLQPRSLITDVKLQAIVEAAPNRDSRVTLSDRRDALGMPRVRVAWLLDDLVQRTFDRTFAILAEELRMSGVAQVKLDEPLEGRAWPAGLEGTWHHMGTTRMHDSPREGVVDRHCAVHGVANLHIAGSSVFPSVGANFPTITITALALRLAERLADLLGKPDAVAANDARVSISGPASTGTAVDLPFAAATLSRIAKE
jgi:choline dehydrogenase-like flavoprotein